MSIEAPLSKYRKHNLLIYIAVLAGLGVWFWYDGHYNQSFIRKHTVDNEADGTLEFNRRVPPFMLLGAGIFAIRYWMLKDRKLVADEQGLVYNNITIQYNQIESIDKTPFKSKGYFVISYTDGGQKKTLTLHDKNFDNLPTVLDYLVSKITS